MLRCEAIVDGSNDGTASYKCSNETFVMAGMPETPASSMKDYDDRVLCFFRSLLVVAIWVIPEKVNVAGRCG